MFIKGMIGVLITITALLSSCSERSPITRQSRATPKAVLLISQTIGVQGGTLALRGHGSPHDNLMIMVPPGAVAQAMEFTASIPATVDEYPPESLPIELGPHGPFRAPVEVQIPFQPTLIEQGDDPEDLIALIEDDRGNIEFVMDPMIDPVTNTATLTLEHFSIITILFPRHYKLYRQPHGLFDGTPVSCQIGITHTIQNGSVRTVYHPLVGRGPASIMMELGKGRLDDFFSTSEGNVLLIHGVVSSPADFAFDINGIPNAHDLLRKLRESPRIKNVASFQYQSGLSIDANAFMLARFLSSRAKTGFQCTIIGFSAGGLVARTAIETYNSAPYVESLITLGTPHEGGSLHNVTDFFAKYNMTRTIVKGAIAGIGDIIIGNSFLTKLNADYPRWPRTTKYYTIAANMTDGNGGLLDHDGLVHTGSANTLVFKLPQGQIHTISHQNHNELHANADENGVAVLARVIVTGNPNIPPDVDAGQDQTIRVNTTVTLNGKATDRDPEDRISKIEWTQFPGQVGAPPLYSTGLLNPTFTPTIPGVYRFELHVSDSLNNALDWVVITVTP